MSRGNNIALQATLSAASAMDQQICRPHHPITCQGDLRFNEDNSFECDHARVESGDNRTQACVTHSIALMLINLADELL